jgi:preprotein translocase subunit SecA
MNKQRQEIYSFRNEVLHAEEMQPIAIALLENVCHQGAELFFKSRSIEGGWDPEGYRRWLMQHFPLSFEETLFDQDLADREEIAQKASEQVISAFTEKMNVEGQKIPKIIQDMPNIPPPSISEGLRYLFIHGIDPLWQEHLHKMDHLRVDVTLRSVGQRDPLMEFKQEAFTLFHELSSALRTEIAQRLFRFEIIVRAPLFLQSMLPEKILLETTRSFLLEQKTEPEPEQTISPPEPPEASKVISLQVFNPRVGRNDLCPCGSGKKYKKCCAPLPEEI